MKRLRAGRGKKGSSIYGAPLHLRMVRLRGGGGECIEELDIDCMSS